MTAKKGQGLPLNTIIIAILVMTVLVVLIVVLTNGIGKFSFGLGDCETQSGQCMDSCPSGYAKAPLAKCSTGSCCIKVEEKTCTELGGECYSAGTPAHSSSNGVWVCDEAAGYEEVPSAKCPPSEAGNQVKCCKQSIT